MFQAFQYVINPLWYWFTFPVLFTLTRLGLMTWCLFGLINLFIKTEPVETSKILKKTWFCLGLVVWKFAGCPVDFQTFPTAIVILGLILSWSWLFVFVYAIKVRRAKPIIYVILIGIVSTVYWYATPSGKGHISGRSHFTILGKVSRFAFELEDALSGYLAANNQRFPKNINELSMYFSEDSKSFLSELEMPNSIKSKTIRSGVIICYEKEISPEKTYFIYRWEDPEWETRPRGRYVFYATGRYKYLEESEFQHRLKSMAEEY